MSRDAATFRCPSCGAPAAADAARCHYCQSRLATVGCPVCLALLFDGAAYCPSCGAARSRTQEPQPHTTKCPACRGDMHWVGVGDVDLLECAACDGTWIESVAFEQLCARREQQSAIVGRGSTRPSAGATVKIDRVRYRPCPQCGTMMNRTNFGRVSGAIVDVCSGHGTFLDRGELHHIVRFILEGGLERTREAEIGRLKEEQQRLRDLLSQLNRSRLG